MTDKFKKVFKCPNCQGMAIRLFDKDNNYAKNIEDIESISCSGCQFKITVNLYEKD